MIEIQYYEDQRIEKENEVQTQECKQMNKTQFEKDVLDIKHQLD